MRNKIQYIWNKVRKIKIATYWTVKGHRLLEESTKNENLTAKEKKKIKAELVKKYQKNRYAIDPSARIVKSIKHVA